MSNPVLPPPPAQPQPAWGRDIEGWAIARELQVHAQALWQYGELAVFALMWHTMDFTLGLVPRCYRCWKGDPDGSAQSAEQQIAAAYGQGNQYACPVCYNTTYALPEGTSAVPGVRALIVRPGIFDDFDRNTTRTQRGVFNTAGLGVETTPDFRVRTGDYCFRADGSRFQLDVPRRITLRTGFGHPWQESAGITYNFAKMTLEDPLTTAYQVPPGEGLLPQVLGAYTRIPADYSWTEVINGPLIPGEDPPPVTYGGPQGPVTFPLHGAPGTTA